jgi:2,3-dihydroxybenzoate-AMP ligase
VLDGVAPFPPEFAARYRQEGFWQDQSLADEFGTAFRHFADRYALIEGDRRYTYRDIDAFSRNLALNLLELGLQLLDRVVLTLPTAAEFVLSYVALQRIGAIPVTGIVAHRYHEISQFVRASQATTAVYPETHGEFRFGPTMGRIQEESPCLRFRLVLGTAGPGERSLRDLIAQPATLPASALERIHIAPDDPAVLLLSGGTTGTPKLVPRTHNDYAYNSRAAAELLDVTRDSVLLLVLPIAHNLALGCPGIRGFMLKGATIVLRDRATPAEMFALIERHGVTHVKVVPALLVRLINDPSIGDFDLSSLTRIQSGGQRMQPEVRLRTRELMPAAFVQENFGMAEGLLMFARPDDPAHVKLHTCGRPMSPGDEVKLCDEAGNEVRPGEVGELTCRGPYTLRGYYGDSPLNATQFTADGFYRTGDLMLLDPTGSYVVEGRKKDLINRGGEKISAEEIENLILTHAAVRNAACVAMPDPVVGERMCAFVIPHEGCSLTLAELVAFLTRKEIAKFKLPERLELVADFPLSPFGKVSKKDLVAQIARRLEQERGSG